MSSCSTGRGSTRTELGNAETTGKIDVNTLQKTAGSSMKIIMRRKSSTKVVSLVKDVEIWGNLGMKKIENLQGKGLHGFFQCDV